MDVMQWVAMAENEFDYHGKSIRNANFGLWGFQ